MMHVNIPLMPRVILLHYHLFKNAGTSLDQVLKENFGSRWVTREFENRANAQLHREDIASWIADNPTAVAFSSHTIELPPPEIPGVKIIPLIFIRHPIDRIASAYAFERKQGSGGFGSVLARNTTLAGYCSVRLALPRDRQCRNFHCDRFSRMFPSNPGSELERSMLAVRALPFVGVVESFYGSMRRLSDEIIEYFPDFKARDVSANVTRDTRRGLEEKINALKAELGEDDFLSVSTANEDDFQLYDFVVDYVNGRGS